MNEEGYDELYHKYGGTPSKMTFTSKLKKVLFSPHEFFEKVKTEPEIGDAFKFYLIFLLIFSVIYSILFVLVVFVLFSIKTPTGLQGITSLAGGLTGVIRVVGGIIGVFVGGIIGVFIGGLWLHLWVYIVGGRKGLTQTIKTVLYSATPSLLFGWISLLFLGIVGGFTGLILAVILELAFSIWTLILNIIGIKTLHEISTGRAVLAVIIPTIIIPVVISLLLGGLTYTFLAGEFVSRTSKVISLASTPTCPGGSINLILINEGTQPIAISELKFYIEGEEATPSCTGSIDPGSSKACTIGSGLSGAKAGKVVGPSNQESFFAICP